MSSAICLVDTSVFCEILRLPGMCGDSTAQQQQFEKKLKAGETFLLPLTTILETGNHIAQRGTGDQRRAAAERFVRVVSDALQGHSPFTPTPSSELSTVARWLDDFPDSAMRGMGLGDLSILEDLRLQKNRNRDRRVYIWSLDKHLASYS